MARLRRSNGNTKNVPIFLCGTLLIWLTYFWWRPPAPMMQLKHIEHWREKPVVSLTFDDGPHPISTPLLLESLRRTNIKATFFVVGDGLQLYPELAQRMVRNGHQLANHSQYHHNLTRIPSVEYSNEILRCFEQIERVYRDAKMQPNSTQLFRPPGGGLNRDAMAFLQEHDITLAWWSHNVGDWSRPPAWKIAQGVTATMRAGDIILLHDGGVGTPQAIFAIARAAREKKLLFAPMPEERP